MEKYFLFGMFALILLVQLPFISSLDDDICEELPSRYEDDCEDILDMDLSDREKRILIENLEDHYTIRNIPTYPSLFTNEQNSVEIEEQDYNPLESIRNKYKTIYRSTIFTALNFIFYIFLKRYWGLFV